MNSLFSLLKEKKIRLDSYRPFPIEMFSSLQEWYKIELTYTSNAIEGNTLSRVETAMVVEKGLTVDGKTLIEHIEAVNHAKAFEWVINRISTSRLEINKSVILELHQQILQNIDNNNAGRFRNIPVRIAGSTVIMPNAIKVPELMDKFVLWLRESDDDALNIAIDAHFKLVSIHPFVDGNGRTARLLMNLLLMQAGYPPAIIKKEDRKKYIISIEKAQLGGKLSDYYNLMYQAIDQSFDIYFNAFEEKEQKNVFKNKDLLKIGELARLVGETVPTIRHWTKEGIIPVIQYSQGGYQLYDQNAVRISSKIRKLQNSKRLTLSEIKKELAK